MVTEKIKREVLSARENDMCSFCQMAVVWVQNQLKRKATKEKVINYVNQVIFLNQLLQKPKLLFVVKFNMV